MRTIRALASIARIEQAELQGGHRDFRFVNGAAFRIGKAGKKIAERVDFENEMLAKTSFENEVHAHGRTGIEIRRVHAVIERVKPGARWNGRPAIAPAAAPASKMQVGHWQAAQAEDGE